MTPEREREISDRLDAMEWLWQARFEADLTRRMWRMDDHWARLNEEA